MRIRVIPSELRALSIQWKQMARLLDESHHQLQHAWNGLDWETQKGIALEALVIQARRQAMTLIGEAERLGRFLDERAAAFEQADSDGSARLIQTTIAWVGSMGGLATSQFERVMSFPASRAQGYLHLGDWLGSDQSPPAPLTSARVEPQERRALFEFALGEIISKMGPLGLLKDGWEIPQIPAWQTQVQQSSIAWREALARYGANAPQTQTAYGNYFETTIFKMPFFGDKAEALISFLKIVGRMNPVE